MGSCMSSNNCELDECQLSTPFGKIKLKHCKSACCMKKVEEPEQQDKETQTEPPKQNAENTSN